MTSRRGFTLIELMLSITIMLIVTGAIYRLIVSSQRITRSQAERVSLQSNVRIGSLAVLSDLRELNTVTGGSAAENDILAIAPNSRAVVNTTNTVASARRFSGTRTAAVTSHGASVMPV